MLFKRIEEIQHIKLTPKLFVCSSELILVVLSFRFLLLTRYFNFLLHCKKFPTEFFQSPVEINMKRIYIEIHN